MTEQGCSIAGQPDAHKSTVAADLTARDSESRVLFLGWLVNSSYGLVLRVSAVSEAVDSGLISRWVKPMNFKLVFTASLLDAQHYWDSVENKRASLLVMPL